MIVARARADTAPGEEFPGRAVRPFQYNAQASGRSDKTTDMATQLENTGNLERKLSMTIAMADIDREVDQRLRKLDRKSVV